MANINCYFNTKMWLISLFLPLKSYSRSMRGKREGSNGSRWWYMNSNNRSRPGDMKDASGISYKKFIDFALEETKSHTHLAPSPLQENFNSLMGLDGRTKLQMLSFEAPKVRLLRCLSIEASDGMQVLDLAVFPKPEFDLPIFCASFFTAASTNIVVLDLNPLHSVLDWDDYKEKYYRHLIPLGLKYTELLPWGGKITSESLRFFSPIVIWTKFSSSQYNYNILFSAFKDYYKAWLEMMNQAVEDMDGSQIDCNCEAQHRYLTWRAEKDPGYRLLKKLVGEALAKEIVRSFLFNGVHELGGKKFLDYFPEYKTGDGTVNEKRSMIGKSFENRPWDSEGNFLGNGIR